MKDLIKREDVLRIIEARFSEMMIGDILKKDVETLPEAAVRTGDRISRCELFNRLATITAEDPNDMKAKIYAVIQEMETAPERVIQPVHVHIDTDELMERIREEYELEDNIVRCKECKYEDDCEQEVLLSDMYGEVEDTAHITYCSYGEREGE